MRKEIFIGFVVGLLATAIGFYVYTSLALEGSFKEVLQSIKQKGLLGQVISLGAIPNLIAFFVFIKKRQDYRARGVLMATFLIAILVLISQFL